MRNIIRNILFAAVVAGATSACVKTDGEVVDTSSLYYHAADNTLTIGGDETETTLHVEADCSWQIATVADWLQVSPQSGSGNMDVQVIADGPNPSWTTQREAELVLTTQDGISKRIAVVQGPSTRLMLEVSPQSLSLAANETSAGTILISSNVDWSISAADWVRLSLNDGSGDAQVSVSCDYNYAMVSRSCVLTVQSANGLAKTVELTQGAATLPVLATPEIRQVEETKTVFGCAVAESMFDVTECGIYIGTTNNPTAEGQKWKADTPAMAFEMTVTGLDKKQIYYVCAYAVSPVGTAYSDVVTITTLSVPKEGDNDKPNY